MVSPVRCTCACMCIHNLEILVCTCLINMCTMLLHARTPARPLMFVLLTCALKFTSGISRSIFICHLCLCRKNRRDTIRIFVILFSMYVHTYINTYIHTYVRTYYIYALKLRLLYAHTVHGH